MFKLKEKLNLNNFIIETLDLARTVLICILVVFAFTTFLLKPVKVDGSSMYPTLEDGEYGFSYVLGALLGQIERFDVVIVESVDEKLLVKRVIALPGETIEYLDDELYINNEIVEEPFLDETYVLSQIKEENSEYFTENFGPYELGEDEFFVMGDNRLRSYDSRNLGFFNQDRIVSKSVFVLYPFDKIGVVSN